MTSSSTKTNLWRPQLAPQYVQDPPISHQTRQQNDVATNQQRSVDLY